jgi:outer membrane protein assembly factor BamB
METVICSAVSMVPTHAFEAKSARVGTALGVLLLGQALAPATDWPQYRGPATDGSSPDLIATTWATNSAGFVVWTNMSLTNGFSCFAVSQGRAFTLISRRDGTGSLREYCAAVDAATGANLWATPIDDAPWDPSVTYNGGDGSPPYNTGDGPRPTPSVKDGRVVALSSGLSYPVARLHLVCLNATNGSVIWSNDLASAYGASTITWENAASPCLDNDLVFVNLNSSTNSRNLAAFRMADGGLAWSSQAENVTHTTPVVATIQGVRQVIFATQTGLVSLDRSSGAFLWKFSYPFGQVYTSMGASPLVYSNIVYCTASYGKGAVAARVMLTNGTWTATQLWYKDGFAGLPYRSIWMSPVCYQGYIYTLAGDNSTYLSAPLNCIELSTGTVRWSTNNFGMGGLILVNTNLLVLTERGQLVLVRPTPSAYVELARYQAFQFSANAPGKCWNNPSFSDGRIYARSTRGGICLDVSVPTTRPPLKLLGLQFLTGKQLQLVVSTVNGTPIDANRLAGVKIYAAARLPASTWARLTNSLVLINGSIKVTLESTAPQRYLIAVEPPGSTPGLVQSLQRLPGGLQLHVGSADGNPLAPSRVAGIEILSTTNLVSTVTGWSYLTNSLTLTNGVIQVNLEPSGQQRYFIATEQQ